MKALLREREMEWKSHCVFLIFPSILRSELNASLCSWWFCGTARASGKIKKKLGKVSFSPSSFPSLLSHWRKLRRYTMQLIMNFIRHGESSTYLKESLLQRSDNAICCLILWVMWICFKWVTFLYCSTQFNLGGNLISINQIWIEATLI